MKYGRAWQKEVMIMATADDGGPVPDLYRLLGVSRRASGGEIAQTWRRRALAEHPDRRPRDAAAPARFRALAEAYRVLGDPARRAAYDRSLTGQSRMGAAVPGGPPAAAPGRRRHGTSVAVGVKVTGRMPEPPLRAGPVWVDVPPSAAARRAAGQDAARLAALAERAVRYLAGGAGWPW
jgi:curved DNA-binding protein CbpA